MVTDWVATLKEQSQIVQRLAKGVLNAIAHPDLTLDQTSQIYSVVEKGAQDFDRIMIDMNRHNDRLYLAASRLEDIWAALSVAAANKVRTMQGFEPAEFSDRREECPACPTTSYPKLSTRS